MPSRKFYLLFLMPLILLVCCKKEINPIVQVASITVVNASPDNPQVVAVISDTLVPFYRNTAPIDYGSAQEYAYCAGKTPLILTSSADTVNPFFRGDLDLKSGGTFSFFIAGELKDVDTLLLQDVLPTHQDSSGGVRFINLSTNSQPMSVNLAGNDPSQTEFSGLAYKQASSFKAYTSDLTTNSYTFEIRDQSSGNLLTTFYWTTTLRQNNTLVISGSEDPASSTPIQVFQVNHY